MVRYLIALALPVPLFGQSVKSDDCNTIKYGTFYFYPANSQNRFIVIRKQSFQEEINLKTSDTSFWKVNWTNACEFNLKFIRTNRVVSTAESDFYNAHVTVIKISKITEDYYVFKGGLDSLGTANAVTDTVWYKLR